MRLDFRAKTNKEYVMINTAKFKLPSGSIITVDRQETDYDITDGILNMEWIGCYLWEIDGINIYDEEHVLNEEAEKMFIGAKLISLELEDDADKDYKVKQISWSIG